MLPAVPLLSSRAANQGRTTFQKPAPRNSVMAAIGSSRFEPNWRTFPYANSDRFPVCAGPTCVGIKPWLSPRHRQSWTGWPARCRDGLAHLHNRNGVGLLPLRYPCRVSKRNKFRSPWVCRDAQRRADKLGRHARCGLCRPLRAFCQGSFQVPSVFFAKLPAKSARALPHQWAAPVPKRLGISTLTPGPIVEEIATRLM